MKKILIFTLGLMIMLHTQQEIGVSIMNKTHAPLSAQIKDDPTSLQIIQPNTTGFITIDRNEQRHIDLTQEAKGNFGPLVRTGSIPTVNVTNYSFMILVGPTNNLIAVPAQAFIKPTISGPGILGRL